MTVVDAGHYSSDTENWIRSSGPIDHLHGVQVPKAALLHNFQIGPHRTYSSVERARFSALINGFRRHRIGDSTNWVDDLGLRPEEMRTVKLLLDDDRVHRMKGVTQTLGDPEGRFTNRFDHGVYVGYVAGRIAIDSGMGSPALSILASIVHDIGHAPGHHPAEEALNLVARNLQLDGRFGFKHPKAGEQVLVDMALDSQVRSYMLALALNAAAHSWPLKYVAGVEAAYVTVADRIGYVASDFADGLRAGIIEPGQVFESAPYFARWLGLDKHRNFVANRRLDESQASALIWHIGRSFARDVATQIDARHMIGFSAEGALALSEGRAMNAALIIGRADHERSQARIRDVHVELTQADIVRLLADKTNGIDDEYEAYRRVTRWRVGQTEQTFADYASERLPALQPAELTTSPLTPSERVAVTKSRKASPALLPIDQLLPVTFTMPATLGTELIALSFSQAKTVLEITLAKHPFEARDRDGRRVLQHPLGAQVLADRRFNPHLATGHRVPLIFVRLDSKEADNRSYRLRSGTEQWDTAVRARTAIFDALRKAARELDTTPLTGVRDARRRRSLEALFAGHEGLRRILMQDEVSTAASWQEINSLLLEYSVEQRSVDTPNVVNEGLTLAFD